MGVTPDLRATTDMGGWGVLPIPKRDGAALGVPKSAVVFTLHAAHNSPVMQCICLAFAPHAAQHHTTSQQTLHQTLASTNSTHSSEGEGVGPGVSDGCFIFGAARGVTCTA